MLRLNKYFCNMLTRTHIHTHIYIYKIYTFCMQVRFNTDKRSLAYARLGERQYIQQMLYTLWRVCALSQLITTHVAATQAKAFLARSSRRHRESTFCHKRRCSPFQDERQTARPLAKTK